MPYKKQQGVVIVGDANSVNINKNNVNVNNTGVAIEGVGNIGYSQKISTSAPGLVMVLIDQSGSMAENSKAKLAATAVNRVIYEIILSSQTGYVVKNRVFVGVIGYGISVSPILSGMVSEIADKPIRIETVEAKLPDGAGGLVSIDMEIPIWVEASAENGTPMAEAFDKAFTIIDSWIQKNPTSFPPIVINITDGAPNDYDSNQGVAPDTEKAALRLMDLKTYDGNLLLFNAHISGVSAGIQEISFPSYSDNLSDPYSKFLFRISSEIPASLLREAQDSGLFSGVKAKGMVYNSSPETFIKLLRFGSSVASR